MKTTKKPMMAKRTTKAAPAKKKMMASAKKPTTVAGKKVKKYQVGGNVTNPGRPSGMPPSNPRVTRPGTAGNMPQAAGNMPRTGGVSPRPAPANVGYGGMLGNMGRGRPGMPANPGQGMVANNRGSITGQSPNYAQANELLARMDPRSPFYNAIQQGVQQMGQAGGLQANNPGGMMNPGMLSPAQIAQNNLARQQLMQRGIQPGQGIGMPIGARGQLGAMGQPNLPPMMRGMQGLGSPGMGMANPSPGAVQGGTMAQDALGRRFMERMQQPSRFRDGGNVKKKKAPASGRMAKPKGRMSAKGKR